MDILAVFYVDQALQCLGGHIEVFPGGFEFALRLFHANLGDEAFGAVDHTLLFQFQGLFVMGLQGIVGFCFHLHDTLAEAQAEVAFDQFGLFGSADLFTVDLGYRDECLADFTGIDAFAACKDGPGQAGIDRRDVLRDERQRQRVLSDLVEKGGDQLVIRDDRMDILFSWIGELVQGLAYLDRVRHMHISARSTDRRIPEGI